MEEIDTVKQNKTLEESSESCEEREENILAQSTLCKKVAKNLEECNASIAQRGEYNSSFSNCFIWKAH